MRSPVQSREMAQSMKSDSTVVLPLRVCSGEYTIQPYNYVAYRVCRSSVALVLVLLHECVLKPATRSSPATFSVRSSVAGESRLWYTIMCLVAPIDATLHWLEGCLSDQDTRCDVRAKLTACGADVS